MIDFRWLWGGSRAPRGRVHCRHCLKPFERRRIGVHCHSRRCRNVPDELGTAGPRFFFADDHQLWSDGRLELRDVPCPFCDAVETLESVCPHCRQSLGLDQGEDQVLAVIGASDSGKTHFLAAVLHQLLDAGVGGGIWRVDLPESKLRVFRERYLDPLFEELEVLPKTPSRVNEELRLPLVNDVDGRRVLLVFRDLGGELFADPAKLARLSFLRYARGVVLMADPLAYEPPPDDGAHWQPNRQPDALQILQTYRQVLEQRERSADEGELPLQPGDKYLAVAVTKADLVLAGDHPFWHDDGDGEHLQVGYWERRKERSREVAEWVQARLDRRLVRETQSFAEVNWFFTSSIGYALPGDQKRLPRPPQPRRVHEPIFALLDKLTEGGERVPVTAGARPTRGGEEPGDGGPAPRQRDRRRPAEHLPDDDWEL